MMAPYSNLAKEADDVPEGLPGFTAVSIWDSVSVPLFFKSSEKSSRFHIITELKNQSNPLYLLFFPVCVYVCACVHVCV